MTFERATKRYGETIAVNQLSIKIEKGQVCVLIGPSGCGKTTTLRMINRLVEPTSGSVFVDGRNVETMKAEELRRSIGYVIQSVGLFPHMTVAQNVAIVPDLLHWKKKRISSRIKDLLTLVGLDPVTYSTKYPAQLSGGEAQRIGVARALAADPPILLMDEPFGSVDPLTRERLQAQFVRIQQALKKTVIMVTHDLDEAIRLADRIAIMEKGRLLQFDIPENILSKPANKFVHDFVGADRALKRLSRMNVKAFVRPSPYIKIGASMQEVTSACRQCKWIWVVDNNQKLLGWASMDNLSVSSSLEEAMVAARPEEAALTLRATLREALSRMLGLGFRSVPVVDDEGRLMGEITLGQIEAATTNSEAQINA